MDDKSETNIYVKNEICFENKDNSSTEKNYDSSDVAMNPAEDMEYNDSNDFLNHNDDTFHEQEQSSSLTRKDSSETYEENDEQPDSQTEGPSVINNLMTKIVNERIKELLDMPDVANFIKSKKKDSVS
ncbi:uncharacterized protein LOC142329355 [Lycorma delicatula]|uniref:uncharacterized protein LOC142329355 n=1 Tax=Lycorma delicatula TaxID=130591 RepID=UPI003F50E9CC